MSLSPAYASPLSSTGYSLDLPAGYDILLKRDGFAVWCDGRGVIETGFDNEAAARFFAQDDAAEIAAEQAEADEAAAEAAYHDELNKLYDLVNAQGGVPTPGDRAEAARVRAIADVLKLIEAVGTLAEVA